MREAVPRVVFDVGLSQLASIAGSKQIDCDWIAIWISFTLIWHIARQWLALALERAYATHIAIESYMDMLCQ